MDIYSTEEFGTFEELSTGINNATGTFEVTKDYKRENDDPTIKITKDNIPINGKNHVLDANNLTIFINYASNVTINDLIFKNAYTPAAGSALFNYGTIILNNVTFINVYADFGGGAVYNEGGVMDLHDVTFINNTAMGSGGAIFNNWGE